MLEIGGRHVTQELYSWQPLGWLSQQEHLCCSILEPMVDEDDKPHKVVL